MDITTCRYMRRTSPLLSAPFYEVPLFHLKDFYRHLQPTAAVPVSQICRFREERSVKNDPFRWEDGDVLVEIDRLSDKNWRFWYRIELQKIPVLQEIYRVCHPIGFWTQVFRRKSHFPTHQNSPDVVRSWTCHAWKVTKKYYSLLRFIYTEYL